MRALGVSLPPVSIVPPGYSPLPAPPSGAPSFASRVGVKGPFVLFVGRLASNKGLLTLVDAFASLRRAHPDAELVLVGEDGGMAPAVRGRAASLGLGNSVHVVGHVPDERELAAAYREARFLALPSDYEAFGLVLLEALAQGTPVIASRVGGIPEFVPDEKAGLLVPPGVPAELARAMERLWSDRELATRLARYGRDEVVPQYTWDALADRLDAVYREVTTR